jgi:predicted HTH domain antitoxin
MGSEVAKGVRKRGEYAVSAPIKIAIEAMASGTARSITDAAELAGLTREALSRALKRENVKSYMLDAIRRTLGVGAVRAAHRMRELMEGSANDMAVFQSARFLLATGAGVVPPEPRNAAVNINLNGDVKAGFVIKLTVPAEAGAPAKPAGPVLDLKASVIDDDYPVVP